MTRVGAVCLTAETQRWNEKAGSEPGSGLRCQDQAVKFALDGCKRTEPA